MWRKGGIPVREYSIDAQLQYEANKAYKKLIQQMQAKGWAGVQHLRNAELEVLKGQRSGKRYNVPGTGRMKYYKRTHKATITYRKYSASAPGEPPAVRTGTFRNSWQPFVKDLPDGVHLRLNTSQNGKKYPGCLENGTKKMKPRPYVERIQTMAEPNIRRVYQNIKV